MRKPIAESLTCNVDCDFVKSRQRVEAIIRGSFGQWAEERPKAITVAGTPHRLEADLIVGLELRKYTGHVGKYGNYLYTEGVELRSREDSETPVVCYPELRRHEIEAYDQSARGRYRPIVRILKCVRRSFRMSGEPTLVEVAKGIPSCLLEGILARMPARYYHHDCSSQWHVLDQVMPHVIELVSSWERAGALRDLGNVKRLFGAEQTWSREHLHRFLKTAWVRLQEHDIPL